jgi:hypothetical protein
VGAFIGENFEASHQKVGTFVVVDGQKQGGNVASYFCLSDGTVVHAVAGPLDAGRFLREAKWAVEVRKLAATEAGGNPAAYRATIRRAHAERLAKEHRAPIAIDSLPPVQASAPPVPPIRTLRDQVAQRLGRQGQVHLVLAYAPLPKLAQLYPTVFEGILREQLSSLPVEAR